MFYRKVSSGIALTLFALASMGSVSAEEIRFKQVKDPSQLIEGMSYVLVGQWADPDNPGFTRYYVMGSYSQTDDPAGRPALEVKLSGDGSLSLSTDMIADGLAYSEKENKALLLDLSSNHYYYFGYELTAHGTKSKLYGYGTSDSYTYGSAAKNACLPLLSSGSIQSRGWDIEFTPRRWYYAWYDDYGELNGVDIDEYPDESDGTVNLISNYRKYGNYYSTSFSSIVFVRTDEGQAYFCGGKSGTAPDEKRIQRIVTNTLLFRQECDHPNLQAYSEEPDCWSSGVSEIWYCDKCDEYFVDKTCTKPTTPEDHYLAPLGHKYGSDGFCVRCATSNREYKWVDYTFGSEEIKPEMLVVAEKDGVAYAMTNELSGMGFKAVPVSIDDQRRIFAAEDNLVVISQDDRWNKTYHGRQLCFNLKTHALQFRPDGDTYWNTASWNTGWQAYDYSTCYLQSYDYYLGLVADGKGGYNFEPVTAEVHKATPRKEYLHLFQKSCLHPEMRHVEANAPTCEKFGNIEFWSCAQCGCTYTAYSAEREILLDDEHTTTIPALRHHYENGSTQCAHCGQEAPIYRRVENQTALAEGGRYLVGAEVDGKVYLLGSYEAENTEEDIEEEEEEAFSLLVDYDPEIPGSAPVRRYGKLPIVVETVPEADGSIRANYDLLERLRPKRMHFFEERWEEEDGTYFSVPAWWDLWNLVTNDFTAWSINFEEFDTNCRTFDEVNDFIFGKHEYSQEDDYMSQSPFGECYWLSVDFLGDREPNEVFANRYRGNDPSYEENVFYGHVPAELKKPYNALINSVYAWWSDPEFDFAYHHGELKSRYDEELEEEEEELEKTEGEEDNEGDEKEDTAFKSPGQIILSDDYETGCYGTYPLVFYYCVEETLSSYDDQKNEVSVVGEDLTTQEVTEAVTEIIALTGKQEDYGEEAVPGVVASINLSASTLAEGMTGDQLFAAVNKAVEETSEVGYNLVASQNLVIVVPAESDIQGTNIINDGVCQNLELTDLQPLSLPDDIVADQFAFSRNFKHNWGTLMLPVSIAVPADLVAQQLTDVDIENRVVSFNQVDALTANVPVIIRAKGVSGSDFRGQQVTVSTTKPAEKMTFEGTYRDIYGSEAEAKGLYVLNSNNEFVPAGWNTHIAPFRAYLKVDSGEMYDAPLRLQVDETTGLMSANGQQLLKVTVIPGGLNLLGEAGTDVVVRNMEGKVCAQLTLSGDEQDVPLPAGAYLVNNSRVIVK